MVESGSTLAELHNFSNVMEIVIWSCALLTLNDLIILIIYLFSNFIEEFVM